MRQSTVIFVDVFPTDNFHVACRWLPLDALQFCLAHTGCRLIIIDPERADQLEPVTSKLSQDAGTVGFLVMNNCDDNKNWHDMDLYSSVIEGHRGTDEILHQDVAILPEDNATIIFTSGTTGLPKGVLSTQRMFLTNVLNVCVSVVLALAFLTVGTGFSRKSESVPTTRGEHSSTLRWPSKGSIGRCATLSCDGVYKFLGACSSLVNHCLLS